jgi:hypothetical protein
MPAMHILSTFMDQHNPVVWKVTKKDIFFSALVKKIKIILEFGFLSGLKLFMFSE